MKISYRWLQELLPNSKSAEDAGAVFPLDDDDLPPDVEEAFLENVLAFETAPKTT